MASITDFAAREAKTQGYSLVLYGISGEYPKTVRHEDHNELILSDLQILAGQKLFLDSLESDPGNVRITNVSKIFFPVLIKKYWPYAAATLLLGGVMGALLKR